MLLQLRTIILRLFKAIWRINSLKTCFWFSVGCLFSKGGTTTILGKEWRTTDLKLENLTFYHFQKYYNSRARRHWIDPRTICHLLHQQMFYFSLLLLAFYQVLVFLFQFVSGFVKLLFPLIITEKRSATCVKITVPMSWATVGGVTINRFIDRHFCTIRMF